jgi:di/tricarboxylate transporter
VLAVNRGDEIFREDVRKVALRAGDTLVLHGLWRDLTLAAEIPRLRRRDRLSEGRRPAEQDLARDVLLRAGDGPGPVHRLKLSVAMLTGAVGMLLVGVLKMEEAYNAINWKTIFTLACLIPLGWAMDTTGTRRGWPRKSCAYLGQWPQWALQTVIAVMALFFSQVVSNVGADGHDGADGDQYRARIERQSRRCTR